MRRSLQFVAALLFAASPVLAQHQAHDSTAMLGTWEGPFATDHGPGGTMQVVVAHDSTGVRATMKVSLHPEMAPSNLTDIKHVGDKVTWSQETGGMRCSGSAGLNTDGALAGTLDCGHAILSFTLTKNAQPKNK